MFLTRTYALLVDKGTEDVINVRFCFFVMYYGADRFYAVVHLFSNRSQKTSKCGKNISDTCLKNSQIVTHSGNGLCDYFLFLPHFDVICDLLKARKNPGLIFSAK